MAIVKTMGGIVISILLVIIAIIVQLKPEMVPEMFNSRLLAHKGLFWLIMLIVFIGAVLAALGMPRGFWNKVIPKRTGKVRWLMFSLATTSDWTQINFQEGIKLIGRKYRRIIVIGEHNPRAYKVNPTVDFFNISRPVLESGDARPELLVVFEAQCEITGKEAPISIEKGDVGTSKVEVIDRMKEIDHLSRAQFGLHKVLGKWNNAKTASSPNTLSVKLDFSYLGEMGARN